MTSLMYCMRDFKENIARRDDRTYEVSFPWILEAELSSTNKSVMRRRGGMQWSPPS